MKNIKKIANEIVEASMKDISTIRAMKMLWDHYKENVAEFAGKLNELFKKNKLSYSGDKWWISQELEKLTGEQWKMTGHDFIMASRKNAVSDEINDFRNMNKHEQAETIRYDLRNEFDVVQDVDIVGNRFSIETEKKLDYRGQKEIEGFVSEKYGLDGSDFKFVTASRK